MSLQRSAKWTVLLGTLGLACHRVMAQNGGHNGVMAYEAGSSRDLHIGMLALGFVLLVIGVLAVAAALIYIFICKKKHRRNGPKGINDLVAQRSEENAHNIYTIDPSHLRQIAPRDEVDGAPAGTGIGVTAVHEINSVHVLPPQSLPEMGLINGASAGNDVQKHPLQNLHLDEVDGFGPNLDGIFYENVYENFAGTINDYQSDSSDESDFEVPPPVRRPSPIHNCDTNSNINDKNLHSQSEGGDGPQEQSVQDISNTTANEDSKNASTTSLQEQPTGSVSNDTTHPEVEYVNQTDLQEQVVDENSNTTNHKDVVEYVNESDIQKQMIQGASMNTINQGVEYVNAIDVSVSLQEQSESATDTIVNVPEEAGQAVSV